jgi:hypothetical protein
MPDERREKEPDEVTVEELEDAAGGSIEQNVNRVAMCGCPLDPGTAGTVNPA